jgi:predicted ATPase
MLCCRKFEEERKVLLKKFEYSSHLTNDEMRWGIRPFELNKINLFTAKNATGKTRTLKSIYGLRALILSSGFTSHANYKIDFVGNNNNYRYILSIENMQVEFEQLLIDDKEYIVREKDGKGTIYAVQIGDNIDFQLPNDKLIVSRRDIIQYPYLEVLHEWAKNMRYYSFGSSMKQPHGKRIDDNDSKLNEYSDNAVEIFALGQQRFGNEFIRRLKDAMHELDYHLSDVFIKDHIYTTLKTNMAEHKIVVAEEDIRKNIVQQEMSQGMFRALSLLIHIIYNTLRDLPTTILIDDIGEGLDFDRSSRLIKLLIEIAEKNDNIQLIMSTNDRFVMNNVPLEYWQVIQRKGGECQVFNYKNSKEKFDEFEYTGLNNFDFLRTDFINSNWEPV